MTAVLFDTLRLSRTLRDKGQFTPAQAEALAEALGEATQDNLATKADLETLRTSVKADMAELKTDILKWIVEAIGFQTIVILGAAFALAKMMRP